MIAKVKTTEAYVIDNPITIPANITINKVKELI